MLFQNRRFAMEQAARHLGMRAVAFWKTEPAELGRMLRAARLRRNDDLAVLAYAISNVMAPHVSAKHRSAIKPQNILFGIPTFRPDKD